MVDKEKGYKTRTYLEKDAPHLVSTKAKLDKIGKAVNEPPPLSLLSFAALSNNLLCK